MPPTSAVDTGIYEKTELGICPQDAIGRRKYQAVLLSRTDAKSKTRHLAKCECYGFQKLPPGLQAAILSVNAGVVQCRAPVSLIPPCRCISGMKTSSNNDRLVEHPLKRARTPLSPSAGRALVHLAKMALKDL
mmetsp:Transcript_4521/g.3695  ORF Transcript_4521/g.3695 Transcript_4521/m.3695 type:complete len:133 (+) Transcript_4521:38-436(+)